MASVVQIPGTGHMVSYWTIHCHIQSAEHDDQILQQVPDVLAQSISDLFHSSPHNPIRLRL